MSLKDLQIPVLLVMLTVNLFSNLVLVLVTWCTKNLRSTCNRLVAIEALLVVVQIAWGGYTYVLTFSIPFTQCVWLLSIALAAVQSQSVMPLIIALERLLNVVFPVWSMKRTSRWYAALMFVPAFIYGVGQTLYYVVVIYIKFPDSQTICKPGVIFTADFGRFVSYKNYAVIGVCWVIYFSIWAVMRARKKASSNVHADTSFRRFTHNLIVIIALISIGWAVSPTVQIILSRLPNVSAEDALLIYDLITSTSLQLQTTLVCPALCLTSSEYRKAFIELVKGSVCVRYFCCCIKVNQQQQQQQGDNALAVARAEMFVAQQRHGGDAIGGEGMPNQNITNNNNRASNDGINNNQHNNIRFQAPILPLPPLPNAIEDASEYYRRINNRI